MAGAIENHLAAGLAEKGEDDRYANTHVLLVLRQRAFVDIHHRGVEGQYVFLGDRALACRFAVGTDHAHEFGNVVAVHRQSGDRDC